VKTIRAITNKLKTHKYLMGIIILCVCNIMIRIPFFNFPSTGDEAVYYNGVLKVLNNNLNPFIEFRSYKPPVIFWLIALLFKVFSPSRIIAHLAVSIFSSCALYFVYAIGKKIRSEQVGLFAAVLLFFTPTFMFQSSLFMDSIFISALLCMTVFAYISKRKILYIISCSILVLTKEPEVFIPFILFISALYTVLKDKTFTLKNIARICYLLVPSVCFGLWILVNKQVFGWYVWVVNTGFISFSLEGIVMRLKQMFIDSGLWPIAIVTLIGLCLQKSSLIKKALIPLCCIFVFYTCLYLIYPPWPRYMLPIYPLLYLMGFVILSYVKSGRYMSLFFLIFMSVLIGSWAFFALKSQTSGSWSEEYLFRKISLNIQTVRYIHENYPNAVIAASSGENIDIYTDTFLGYVTPKTRFSYSGYLFCYEPNAEKEGYILLDNTILSNTKNPTVYVKASYVGPCRSLPSDYQYVQRIFDMTGNAFTYNDIYIKDVNK
jgi:4-amino-4-deoxy-L-arabinose transferase-like glycosyltransferase